MTDPQTLPPTPDSGLADALRASLGPIAEWNFDKCLRRKAELLGDARSFNDLSEPELEEFHAICVRLRQMQQPAGKPAAAKRARGRPRIDLDADTSDFV